MRPRGGKRRSWRWMLAVLSLPSCADHTEEDAKACAGYTCSAGQCQAGANGPECVCGAFEQALNLTCTLLGVDQGTDDDRAHAHPIALNTDVSGAIDVPTLGHTQDVDVYRFDAQPDRVYLIELASGPDLSVRIEDSGGGYQTSGAGTSLRLATPSAGGAEYITVQSMDPHVLGQYVFRVTDIAPAAEPTTLGPAPGSVQGTIAPAGNVDYFVLAVDAGVIYDVGCTFEAALPGTASTYGHGNPAHFKAQPGATHTLSVGGGQTGVGTYRCDLQQSPTQDDVGDSVDTALLLPGPPASFDGRADAPPDQDVFAIQAHAGKYLWAHTSACYAAFVPGPGQQIIQQIAGANSHPGLLGDELAYLSIYCSGASSYHLAVEELIDAEGDTPATAAPVTEGAINGRLEGPEDEDVFLFLSKARHVYTLDLPVIPSWQVTGAHTEQALVRANGGYQQVFVPAADGPLYLTISWSAAVSAPLVYATQLADTGLVDPEPDTVEDAISAAVGVAVQGVVQFDGDRDCFAFDLPVATTMTLELDRGYPTLWFPDGGQLSVFSPFTFDTGPGGRHVICVWYSGGGGGGVLGGLLEQVPYTLRVHP